MQSSIPGTDCFEGLGSHNEDQANRVPGRCRTTHRYPPICQGHTTDLSCHSPGQTSGVMCLRRETPAWKRPFGHPLTVCCTPFVARLERQNGKPQISWPSYLDPIWRFLSGYGHCLHLRLPGSTSFWLLAANIHRFLSKCAEQTSLSGTYRTTHMPLFQPILDIPHASTTRDLLPRGRQGPKLGVPRSPHRQRSRRPQFLLLFHFNRTQYVTRGTPRNEENDHCCMSMGLITDTCQYPFLEGQGTLITHSRCKSAANHVKLTTATTISLCPFPHLHTIFFAFTHRCPLTTGFACCRYIRPSASGPLTLFHFLHHIESGHLLGALRVKVM